MSKVSGFFLFMGSNFSIPEYSVPRFQFEACNLIGRSEKVRDGPRSKQNGGWKFVQMERDFHSAFQPVGMEVQPKVVHLF